MEYVNVVCLDELNPNYNKLYDDTMRELGYCEINYKNKNFYYQYDKKKFIKLKLKYSDSEIVEKLHYNRKHLQQVPRTHHILVRYAKKYKMKIVTLRKGTKYYLKYDSFGKTEKLVTMDEIEWLEA